MSLYNMAEETIEEVNPAEKRIKDLSEKVKLTATERDEKDKLLKEKEVETESLKKENEFFKSFGTQVSKFPEASAFQDKIKEKVMNGYSMEDATAAVLVAEGKYQAPRNLQPIGEIAGGSATTVHQSTDRTLGQMSRDEKRAKLLEAEQRGDLTVS